MRLPAIRSMILAATSVCLLITATSSSGAEPGELEESTRLEQDYQTKFDAMMEDFANPERSFEFVQVAVKTGDLRGAIAALERILKIDPDLSNIRLELGLLYLRVGSPELAAAYIRQTLQDPAVPSWIRTRAQVLLAQAEGSATRHFISGTVYLAGRYDSNANAGPSGQEVRVGGANGLLDEQDTGQESASAELIGTFQYAYALDSQSGNQIEVDFLTYNRRYEDTSSINTNVVDLDVGPRFFFGPIFDPDFSLRPYVSANYLWLDDDGYMRGLGGGLNIRKLFGLRALADATLSAEHQDFSNSSDRPTADDRTGPYYSGRGRLSYQLLPRTLLFATASGAKRDSDEDFESFDEGGGGLGVTQTYNAPFGVTGISWSSSLSASIRRTVYDEADPSIDPDEKRKDTRIDVNFSTNIPVSRSFTVVVTGLYTDNDSNLPNFDYDNWAGSLGVAFSM